jgi:polyhydroxyalkanoate synthesis regulator phasin
MATMYSANITKDIAPAMADPSAAMAATKTNASIFGALADIGGEVSKGYMLGKAETIRDEATQLQQEFLVKGQAQAEQQRLTPAYEAMQKSVQNIQEDGFATPQQLKAAEEPLTILDERLARLKEAAQGGMSNDQYVTRINALETKYTTQYPGLTDKIREIVGKNTGMVGGSLWAQEQYVKERFTPQQGPKAKTPEEMAIQDMNDISASGMATREELLNAYRGNKPLYDSYVKAHKQIQQTNTQNAAIKQGIETQHANNDDQANKVTPGIITLFNGLVSNHVVQTSAVSTENYYRNTLGLLASGKNISSNPEAFTTAINMHVANMKAGITVSKNAAEAQLNDYFSKNSLTDSKKTSMRGDLDRAAKIMEDNYANDRGLVAMATIMQTHADKNVTQQKSLIDLYIRQVAAGFTPTDVQTYHMGGAAKEALKKRSPDMFASLEKLENNITDAFNGVSESITKPNTLANIAAGVEAAKTNPSAVVIPASVPKEDKKAIHETLFSNAKEILNKTNLTPGEISLISCSFATNVEQGSCNQDLVQSYPKIKDRFKTLSEEDQGTIKNATSNASITSVTGIQSLRDGINAKYDVSLVLGMNPSGKISILPPPVIGGQAGSTTAAQGYRDQYTKAAKEYMDRAAPILNNLVTSQAMLTDRTPQVIGAELTTVLNGKTAYNGFYSSKPKAVPSVPAAPVKETKGKIIVNVPGGTITFDTKEQADAFELSRVNQ